MIVETIGSVILIVIAVLGFVGGGIAWFYKRGGQEKESSIALRDNTKATTELTAEMREFMKATREKQDQTDSTVNDHTTRIALAELNIKALDRRVNNANGSS